MRFAAGLTLAFCVSSVTGAGLLVASTTPRVSVWYRGSPAGTPVENNLARIRAHGFNTITWPVSQTAGAAELRRLAGILGLAVDIRGPGPALTEKSALAPPDIVNIATVKTPAAAIPGLAWRAIAHGARVITFDPGTPGELSDAAGRTRDWVAPALAMSRQLEFNARLISELRAPGAGTAIRVEPPAPAPLDVVLLQDDQSWVLVATNASLKPVQAVVQMPPVVPAALWVSLIDGSRMSMLAHRDGPRWTLELGAGGALVYIVTKRAK